MRGDADVRRHCGRVVERVGVRGVRRVEYCLKSRRRGVGFDIVGGWVRRLRVVVQWMGVCVESW